MGLLELLCRLTHVVCSAQSLPGAFAVTPFCCLMPKDARAAPEQPDLASLQ